MTDITIDNRGVKLAVSIDGPVDADPLLFLHGMSHSRDTWAEVAERLKGRYQVYSIDFRGHGHSDRAVRYELADCVSDAEAALVSNSPSPMGGISSDHFGARHLLSHASALQRQDGRCWGDATEEVNGSRLAAIETKREFQRPAKIIQADPLCGAALLECHEIRFARTTPDVEIVQYRKCGHAPHRTLAFEERFAGDLESFISKVTSR